MECRFEDDVLDALRTGRWAAGADAALQAHVRGCASCTDLVEVAGALLDGRDDVHATQAMPSADVVWYRAQVRARHDAARAAARPIALAQGIALGCVLGLIVAIFGIGWPAVTSWAGWFWGALPTLSLPTFTMPTLDAAATPSSLPRLILLAIGAFLLFVVAPATLVVVWTERR